MIDSIADVASKRLQISDPEKLAAWAMQQKEQKLLWLSYDEERLAFDNRYDLTCEGAAMPEEPVQPLDGTGRLLKRNAELASPLGAVGTDNYVFLKLIVEICALSAKSAALEVRADFSDLLLKIFDEFSGKHSSFLTTSSPVPSTGKSTREGKISGGLTPKPSKPH
ncbi:hypothetical protein [Duganella callida]|uniref:Uncharacterized protein n=1 Tax=Duganella callida TaxID=2561932 RepID=A0A4Y9SAD3_9BURK|nr:hypothetical protein [Duganella callida]TFW18854.1 hypothetical protein E4L98_17150 [Duganella callida]